MVGWHASCVRKSNGIASVQQDSSFTDLRQKIRHPIPNNVVVLDDLYEILVKFSRLEFIQHCVFVPPPFLGMIGTFHSLMLLV